VIAEAMIAAGHLLGRDDVLGRWVDGVAVAGRPSSRRRPPVTPSRSQVPNQGIVLLGSINNRSKLPALADACDRARVVTGDTEWRHGVDLAVDWFAGANDVGVMMSDPVRGAASTG
jgi:hypothetical protein